MAKVLAISSQVVRGHVGNSAAVLALQRMGHDVWPLPTVVLSNHPGHAKVAGMRMAPDAMRGMLQALAGNGWLGEIDAILTGYLPSAEHVAVAAEAIAMVRAAGGRPLVLADPVIGDDPEGLYIEESAAEAIRDVLVPLAHIITPNRFELQWLSGRTVTGIASALAAAACLNIVQILATSIPEPDAAELANILCGPDGATKVAVPRLGHVPHGTGDLIAALFLGHRLNGKPATVALNLSVAGVRCAIEASAGADELRLVTALESMPLK